MLNDYYSKYLKYKSKYIYLKNHYGIINYNSQQIGSSSLNYMNKDDIELIKERIQFLTHYTTLENFFLIIKSKYLIHQKHFDVTMMSIFPTPTFLLREFSYKLPLEGNMLYEEMFKNVNISFCHLEDFDDIILLFDPKLLWKYKYYYISTEAYFGTPEDDAYVSNEIRNLINKKDKQNLNSLEEKILNIINPAHYPTTDIWYILRDLSHWPEIGFYEPVDVEKYIIGIVIPKKFIHNKKLKSIVNQLNIRIFICSKQGIYNANAL